ncbi:MAG: 4'-phosphopantetheinyl transferase superfamily protein [Candidatus Riflebacteria bacterium]|nr:4'-phosphopantetheinyl transferase superfamily protein [Candidatus Riflebacteria bacterium]
MHVWSLPARVEAADRLAPLLGVLRPEELERRARFVPPAKRFEFAVGKLLTRWVLSRYGGGAPSSWRFSSGAAGKPVVPGQPFRFNLSHTAGQLALVVAREIEVGVDVETIEPRDPELARRFFARPEVELLESAPGAVRPLLFTIIWTLKEAWIKACGGGLSIPLDSFSVADGLVRVAASGVGVPTAGPGPGPWSDPRYGPRPATVRSLLAEESPCAAVWWPTGFGHVLAAVALGQLPVAWIHRGVELTGMLHSIQQLESERRSPGL